MPLIGEGERRFPSPIKGVMTACRAAYLEMASGERRATPGGGRIVTDGRDGRLRLARGAQRLVKWSRKSGQVAKVYPIDLKGYENGETPEFFGRV
ncbi:hypothetical protein ACSSV1_006247 [Labrenzia sp. MBR-25]